MVRSAVATTRNLLFIRWLRSNLSMGAALIAVLSAGTTGLVTGTLRVSAWDHRLDAGDAITKELIRRVDALDADRIERDNRRVKLANDLGAVNSRIDALVQRQADGGGRWASAAELGTINTRLGVLDAQMAYVGSFIRDNTGLVAHPAGHK